MSFSAWKKWYHTLPLSLKWFVILVLIRPIIDNFYYLKEISPFLSPLYIVGFLTPILILWSFLSRRFPKKSKSLLGEKSFGIWSIFVLFNVLLLLLSDASIQIFGEVIKYLTPILIFFYLRHFIRSKADLHGILQAFLYSAIFPGLMFGYELLVDPLSQEYLSAGRGGGMRIQGGYADVMNYAIYIVGTFLISGYFFLHKYESQSVQKTDYLKFGLIIGICVLGCLSIKHTSTWGVFASLSLLFIWFNLRTLRRFAIMTLLIPPFIFFGISLYEKEITPLISKEINVIEGRSDVDRSFNGRMSRWRKYFNVWNEMPLMSNLFGVSSSGFKEVPIMAGGGMHSDYVRVLFLSGIVGSIFYLFFLFYLFYRALKFRRAEKFLILGGLLAIVLHSVTTNPLLYMSYIYPLFAVFAYAFLSKRITS